MKIACCWMYAIAIYGFPPPLSVMPQAIEQMARLGFEYIELEGVGDENLGAVIAARADLKRACLDAGVKVSDFAIVLPDIISLDPSRQEKAFDLFARGLETAAYVDAAYVWIDSYTPPIEIVAGKALTDDLRYGEQLRVRIPPGFRWESFWAHFVTAIHRSARLAAEHGLRLLVEPRVGEVTPNSDALLRMLEDVGADNLGVILDTAHQHAQKELLPLSVAKLAPYIRYVHVADNDGRDNRHLELGAGTIDWEGLFLSLKMHGFNGYYAIDLEKLPDLEEKFVGSKRFLEGWAQQLGL